MQTIKHFEPKRAAQRSKYITGPAKLISSKQCNTVRVNSTSNDPKTCI